LSAELLCQPAYPMMRQEPFIIDSFGTHGFRHALRSRYPQRRCRPLVHSRHFGRLRLYKPTILDSKPTTEFRTTIPLAFKLRFFAVRAKLVFALRHILLDPCPFFWIGLLSPREDFSARRLTPRLPFFATAFRRWQGLFFSCQRSTRRPVVSSVVVDGRSIVDPLPPCKALPRFFLEPPISPILSKLTRIAFFELFWYVFQS